MSAPKGKLQRKNVYSIDNFVVFKDQKADRVITSVLQKIKLEITPIFTMQSL